MNTPLTDKKNAFDLLRIVLALSVLITHSILIGGYKLQDPLEYLSKGQTNLAEFGVMGFFTLSGYLISASFERAKNVWVYLSHRALRIFPGFWICLIVTAFILAPLIYSASGQSIKTFAFTGEGSATDFVFKNFLLKINQWSIRGLLDNAPYRESVNGSLWSLFPEIQCYIFTVAAGALGLFHRNKYLYLIVSVSVFAFFAINFNFSKNFGPTILTLSPALKLYASYFAGTLLYVFRDQLLLDKRGTVFLLLFTLMLVKFGGYNLLSPLLIAMVLINGFSTFECKFKYDISYGLYIYSFPVQQLVFQLFGSKINVLLFITISLLITALLAFLSFILVEKPFMNLRKRTDRLLFNKN